MPTYGYARVSTIDQDLSLQRRTLKAAGCDVIRAEKASGTRRNGLRRGLCRHLPAVAAWRMFRALLPAYLRYSLNADHSM